MEGAIESTTRRQKVVAERLTVCTLEVMQS